MSRPTAQLDEGQRLMPMSDSETLRAENEKLKEQVRSLQKEVAEVRETSQKYLENVAHQLTAPLGAIKWSIEALKDEKVPVVKKQQLLRSVYGQATILVHLIKNFALMSNLQADLELGQFREKPEPIDAMRLAINLANDFQPQAHDAEKKILVENSTFERATLGKRLLMEKNLVAQALSNLLENAVKYADDGTEILVTAEKTPTAVRVSVTSVGIPVSNDEKGTLTTRGFRGKAARQRVPAGTGIGLYLADRVMRLHQGTIEIATVAKRSTFSLVFPSGRLV